MEPWFMAAPAINFVARVDRLFGITSKNLQNLDALLGAEGATSSAKRFHH